MKSRALAFGLVIAATVLQPVPLDASRYKPIYPLRGGVLGEDSTCPAATHVVINECTRLPATYLVFNRVKGLKRFIGKRVIVNGPIDSTSCSLPLMDVRKIGFAPEAPPPCEARWRPESRDFQVDVAGDRGPFRHTTPKAGRGDLS